MNKLKKTVDSSKKMIDAHREEEKMLSEEVWSNLKALTYLYSSEASSHLQAYLTKDIFVKSNAKAFPHVMNFLFIIIDRKEFEKRFYWPIDSKTCENEFREQTVHYLNEIIKKHNLKLTEIKKHHIITPGGKKFMEILLKFLTFVMTITIKRKTKTRTNSNSTIRPLTEQRKREIATESKSIIDSGKLYCNEIKEKVNYLTATTQKLIDFREMLYSGVNTNINEMEQSFYLEIQKHRDSIKECEEFFKKTQLYVFKNIIELIHRMSAKSSIEYDRNRLIESVKNINGESQIIVNSGKISISVALQNLIDLLPRITVKINQFVKIDLNQLCNINDSLLSVSRRTIKLNVSMNHLQLDLLKSSAESEDDSDGDDDDEDSDGSDMDRLSPSNVKSILPFTTPNAKWRPDTFDANPKLIYDLSDSINQTINPSKNRFKAMSSTARKTTGLASDSFYSLRIASFQIPNIGRPTVPQTDWTNCSFPSDSVMFSLSRSRRSSSITDTTINHSPTGKFGSSFDNFGSFNVAHTVVDAISYQTPIHPALNVTSDTHLLKHVDGESLSKTSVYYENTLKKEDEEDLHNISDSVLLDTSI